jgi:hypothetical protein
METDVAIQKREDTLARTTIQAGVPPSKQQDQRETLTEGGERKKERKSYEVTKQSLAPPAAKAFLWSVERAL